LRWSRRDCPTSHPTGARRASATAWLNLTHLAGDDEPQPVEPGVFEQVRIQLNGVAQAFPAGHRIRLSLSTSYWPLAWPPPEPAALTVRTGSSRLVLPVRQTTEDDVVPLRPFHEPEGAPPARTTQLEPGENSWTVSRDLVGYTSVLEIIKDGGVLRFDDVEMTTARRVVERYSSVADDFSSPRGEVEWSLSFARGEWSTRTVTRTVLTCTPSTFEVDGWERTIPRDCL
jgi:hypothetical protein